MFATANGTVRRNSMDAFANIPSNGKLEMRFDDESDDRLIGVALLTEEEDVLLATRQGKAIRFQATYVREFQRRHSRSEGRRVGKDGVRTVSHRASTPQKKKN